MERKNLTLIFKNFEQEHLGKDVFMIPYTLGELNNYDVKIICPYTETNKNLGEYIDGVKIIRTPIKGASNLNSYYVTKHVIKYLYQNAKKIDILMCFHTRFHVILMMCFYKLLNPKGIIYNKADGGVKLSQYEHLPLYEKMMLQILLKVTNVISVERKYIYEQLLETLPNYKDKIKLVSNGFDEKKLQSLKIKIKTFEEKDNIIITVGRLGSIVKNTELILEVAQKLDLKNWKILLIGPIEKEEQNFQETIDSFYFANPLLKDKILFIGPVFDKGILWEYYNKAKVFLLSSKSEGFANVYSEAYRFSNYILTTRVGGAEDRIGQYGAIFEGVDELQIKLQEIIDGSINLKELLNNDLRDDVSWEDYLKKIEL